MAMAAHRGAVGFLCFLYLLCGIDFDLPGGLVCCGDGDFDAPGGQERVDALGPFDGNHAALFQQFGETDGLEIVGSADAVGVQMEDGQSAAVVDIQQDERGAGDGTRLATETADQAADELGFSGAQVSVEGDQFATGEGCRQFGGDGFGLLDAGGAVNQN